MVVVFAVEIILSRGEQGESRSQDAVASRGSEAGARIMRCPERDAQLAAMHGRACRQPADNSGGGAPLSPGSALLEAARVARCAAQPSPVQPLT